MHKEKKRELIDIIKIKKSYFISICISLFFMGVDYLVCDHCGESYPDCGDHFDFDIKGVDDSYGCCGSCMNEVRATLKPEQMPDYLFLVNTPGKRFILDTLAEFKTWCATHELADHKETTFCMWETEQFDEPQKSIWLHDRAAACGSFTDPSELKEDKHILKQGHRYELYVAWKDFKVHQNTDFMSFGRTVIKRIFEFKGATVAQVQSSVSRFIEDHSELKGRPFMTGMGSFDLVLPFFASPSEDRRMNYFGIWYKTYASLLKAYDNCDIKHWTHIDSWLPTLAFLKPQLDEIEGKIEEYKTKKRTLEKLIKQKDKDGGEEDEESDDEEPPAKKRHPDSEAESL
jgi:hypothetical protein